MKKLSLRIAVVSALLVMLLVMDGWAEPNANDTYESYGSPVKAAVIICEGMIDDGLYQSIRRRTQGALDAGADYLIYEIGTYGGLVKAADDISKYFILDINNKAHTVAYVSTEAISAGAMISVSCKDIVMRENTTIGCSAPIVMGGKLEGEEREKVESFVRATFKRAAGANGYPEALLEAMVTMQLEVFQVRNIWTGKYEYFETAKLPKDDEQYDIENKVLVVKEGELLTLTASKAFEYGIARAQVKDRAGVFEFLAKRDSVSFDEKPIVFETNWSEEMVRWLNSPAVMGVLVMLALLGVYIEFNTPGLGLPGLVAVICFSIIISSKYLTGLANWVEVAVFVIGLVLLMIEILVLPGFGIAGSLGIICILAGLFGMLIKNPPGKLPWPETTVDWELFTDGVAGLSFGFLLFCVLAWLFSKYMPKLDFLSGLMLLPSAAKQGGEMEVNLSAPPDSDVSGLDIGRQGDVVSTLRPAGKVKFGDAIVDCVAEGEFLDKNAKVEIIGIRGNRVVVRKVAD